jgi:hypothetical protein
MGRPTFPLYHPIYNFIIGCTQMLPNPIFTRDQSRILIQKNADLSLKTHLDDIVDPSVKDQILTFGDLKIKPKSMAEVL